MIRSRIFFTGVGGQGTLTATTLLARTAMDAGLPVTSGEIHGMAQRGGVVESTLLLGGWQSPVISHGEADIVLGFEAVRNIAITVLLFEHLQNKGNAGQLKEAFLRTNLAAVLARDLSQLTRLADPEQACGTVVQTAPAPTGGWDAIVSLQIAAAEHGALHAGSLQGPALTLGTLPYALRDDI